MLRIILLTLAMTKSILAAQHLKYYTVTAYCPCQKCCSYNSGGPTASGKMPKAGETIAAPRHIKFGTKIYIAGVGTRIVQDRLAPKYNNRIDVFVRTHKEARKFGIKKLLVSIK